MFHSQFSCLVFHVSIDRQEEEQNEETAEKVTFPYESLFVFLMLLESSSLSLDIQHLPSQLSVTVVLLLLLLLQQNYTLY